MQVIENFVYKKCNAKKISITFLKKMQIIYNVFLQCKKIVDNYFIENASHQHMFYRKCKKKKNFDNYSIENASHRQMFSRKYNTKKLSMIIL